MDIYIRPEFAIALGIASAALVIAFLWLLVWFVKHLTSFAKALKSHADVNAALNSGLLDNIKQRREDAALFDLERDESKRERAELECKISELRDEAERANKSLGNELVKVKGQLAQSVDKLSDLSRKNERLLARVETLEQEGRKKDRKIHDLDIALTQAEKDKQEQATLITNLQQAINGKVDKMKTGDLSEAKAVTPEAKEDPAPLTGTAGTETIIQENNS